MPPTHDVFNQSSALVGYDVADDPAMLSALRREGGGWAEEAVRELGRLAGEQLRLPAARGQAHHPEAAGVAADDVEGLGADRPG